MTSAAKETRRVGRPYALEADEPTLKTLRGLAEIQCTVNEASAVLGVAKGTFLEFLNREEKAREVWEQGAEDGKASLRRMQWQQAEGNTTMLIWLGKQWLGQRDRWEHSGDPDRPVAYQIVTGVPRTDELTDD